MLGEINRTFLPIVHLKSMSWSNWLLIVALYVGKEPNSRMRRRNNFVFQGVCAKA
jgi:hypothetical protein